MDFFEALRAKTREVRSLLISMLSHPFYGSIKAQVGQ